MNRSVSYNLRIINDGNFGDLHHKDEDKIRQVYFLHVVPEASSLKGATLALRTQFFLPESKSVSLRKLHLFADLNSHESIITQKKLTIDELLT